MTGESPIDDEQLLSLLPTHLHPSGDPNTTRLAETMGRSRAGIQGALARLARAGRLGFKAVLPGFAVKQTSEKRDGVWIKQAPLGETFEVPDGHSVKGVSALVDSSGREIQRWVKTNANDRQPLAFEAIKAEFSDFRGQSEFVEPPSDCLDDLLTAYPIADAHLGLRTWGEETGEDYDLKIGRAALLNGARYLVEGAPKSATALVLNLGDYVHANDSTNATPASKHVLDVDGRLRKILRIAARAQIEVVQLALQRHSHVILGTVGGNHDPDLSHMMAVAMELYFENNPRVTVDPDPSEFFKHRHGKVMIVGNHGHKIKPEDMPGTSAAYWPEDWGATTKRYAFSGHIHHKKSGERHGMRWETFGAIAAKDGFVHSHGYSSLRDMTAITFHKERGEIFRSTVPL